MLAIALHAYVFFSGRYLPYNDWNGHVGLSSVLAHGATTGADVYLERSFFPTPYYLFYVATAFWSLFMPAEIGAKLNLLIATALWMIGTARLAVTTGRHPRVCLIAPLAVFGGSLGLGFASFVFAAPLMLFALSDAETLLRDMREDEAFFEKDARRRFIFLALDLVLVFLGHGLLFVFTVLLIGARVAAHMIQWWRQRKRRNAVRALLSVGLPFLPAGFLVLANLYGRLQKPWIAPEFQSAEGVALAGWASLSKHWATLPGDLLDRGGAGHGLTMGLALVVLGLWIGAGFLWRQPRDPETGVLGPSIYALVMGIVFWFGPEWAGWPITFWVVYQRAAVFFALLLFLVPRTDFSGAKGGALAAVAFVPLIHNALINADYIRTYAAWAAPYDQVRTAIPPRQKVLPLHVPGSLGAGNQYPAAGTLGFLHLADGAVYVPIGNTPEEVPVHRTNDPKTPYNPSWNHFDPKTTGLAYDYLVLRGARLVNATRQAGKHISVLEVGGWTVFRTEKSAE